MPRECLVTGEPDFWIPLVREAAGPGPLRDLPGQLFHGAEAQHFHLLGNPLLK